MLVGECLYTLLKNIKTFWGYQTFLALDGGLTLLEESIADSSIIAILSWGELTLLSFLYSTGSECYWDAC